MTSQESHDIVGDGDEIELEKADVGDGVQASMSKILSQLSNIQRRSGCHERPAFINKLLTRDLSQLTKSLREKMNSANKTKGTQKVSLVTNEEQFINVFLNKEETFLDILEGKNEIILDATTIIGLPGPAKMMARMVFQNEKIRYEFPTRIWVHVSQDFNMTRFLVDILKQLTIQDISSLSYDELLESVEAHLKESKFLLVLDDVWTEHWDDISKVLPEQNRLCKVVITSRFKEVSDRTKKIHKANILRHDQSWETLQLILFGKVGNCPPQLEDIGKSIARHCEGLLPAITVMEGILKAHLVAAQGNVDVTLKAWTDVDYNIRGSKLEDMLALSYNELPNDELRDCFLYLGVFPEDYEIPIWTLTRLWIAEGFIQPREGGKRKSLEKAADDNLKELVARRLVTFNKKKNYRKVGNTCRVEDFVREFCLSKSRKREELNNVLEYQEIKKMSEGRYSDVLECRRLCIHSNHEEFLANELKGPLVHSLLCFGKKLPDEFLNPKYISSIPDGFKLLRVLESNTSVKFHQFPKGITKLIHLRYITLSGDSFRILPEAFSKLWNLQTMVVDTKSRQLTVKANIWKMVMLRHIKTKASIILDIKDDDDEECDRAGDHHQNLQTLTRLSPEHCTENVFSRARNLKTLAIFGKLSNLVDAKSLQKLNHLKNLKLVNDLFYEHMPIDGLLIQSNCFPLGLKRLSLSSTLLKWEHMSKILAKIDSLEMLKLKDNAFTGMLWDATGDSSFRSLRFLMIVETDLVSWEASAEHFPVLKSLLLRNCEKLREIPVGLAKSLRKLDIDRLGKPAVESAKKIEEEKRRFGNGGGFELLIGPGCE